MKYCDVLTLFVQKRETGNRHYARSCLSFVLYVCPVLQQIHSVCGNHQFLVGRNYDNRNL